MRVFYADGVKRLLDITMALLGLTVLWPLMVVIGVAIRLEDGGSVVFRQQRLGRHGVPFGMLKFRSMHENVGNVPSASASTLAVTRVGRLLRRTNLDELPQLVNILFGEMSVVGPRPALESQHDLIEDRLTHGAFEVRPGLTGLAQVSAYNGMSAATKAAFDAAYARDLSLVLDLRIIARTAGYLRHPPPVY